MTKQSKKHVAAYISLVVAGIIFLVVIILYSPAQSHKNDWNLFRMDEPITELAFARHTALPKKYIPEKQTTLQFTIHNLEHQDVTYKYEILQYDAAGKVLRTLASGNAAVKNNHRHTETVSITYGDGGSRSRIQLRLLGQHQTLHYWVERVSS